MAAPGGARTYHLAIGAPVGSAGGATGISSAVCSGAGVIVVTAGAAGRAGGGPSGPATLGGPFKGRSVALLPTGKTGAGRTMIAFTNGVPAEGTKVTRTQSEALERPPLVDRWASTAD